MEDRSMNDSIERIREDAEKHYADYWGCDGRRCGECRARGARDEEAMHVVESTWDEARLRMRR